MRGSVTSAKSIIESIPGFAGSRVLGELSGGPTRRSYQLEYQGELFVLRIDNPGAFRLGLNRHAEFTVMRAAADVGLAPEPVWCDESRGLLLTRWVEGRCWTTADLNDAARLEQLGRAMRRVQELPAVSCSAGTDLRGRIERYTAMACDPLLARQLHEQAQGILKQLAGSAMPQKVCHNDLTAPNIIDADELCFLDWEYAASGSPLFEVAVLVEYHALTAGQARSLLESAGLGSQRADEAPFSLYRELFRRVWALWLMALEPDQGAGWSAGLPARIRDRLPL